MQVITITDENQILYNLSQIFFPNGINIINFKKCANAIPLLNKVDPSVIIVDTDTEPRAWKPLITLIRTIRLEKPVVFLLIMSSCDLDTANEALFLGINGIILKPFTRSKSIPRVIELIKRHIEIEKNRSYVRIKPAIEDSIMFLYNDIQNRIVYKGSIIDISAIGVSLNIKKEGQLSIFKKDEKIENAILKIKGVEIRSDLVFIWSKPPFYGGRFVNINIKEYEPLYKYLLEKLNFIFETNKGEGDYTFLGFKKDQKNNLKNDNNKQESINQNINNDIQQIKEFYDKNKES